MPAVTGAERELLLAAAVIVMAGGLLVVPLGLPGLWIMVAVLAAAAFLGEVAWWTVLALAGLAALAEIAEWVIVKRTSARYGASNKAFWGAILGGIVGMLIGAPIPVVGSLVAGVAGTFLGAAAVAWWESRRFGTAGRAAWGAVVGRGLAAAFKTAAGVAILVLGGAALLLR